MRKKSWIRIHNKPMRIHITSRRKRKLYGMAMCRYVDGAKAASSILSLDQKNVGALFLRGFCLYHKDNVDRAITHFQQVTTAYVFAVQ